MTHCALEIIFKSRQSSSEAKLHMELYWGIRMEFINIGALVHVLCLSTPFLGSCLWYTSSTGSLPFPCFYLFLLTFNIYWTAFDSESNGLKTCISVWTDDHGPGLRSVPVHDPVVQDAASHAVKTIQQRSNSLFPYVLHEISDANAEVYIG